MAEQTEKPMDDQTRPRPERILDAAEELFALHGYPGCCTSMALKPTVLRCRPRSTLGPACLSIF
tara:strand:- start:1605 stop:1796 length:192 start_codon:yes stop_codon:yes gene_type:complete